MKKIVGLTIAALLIIGIVGGGTWAYFSDTETSTGNVFTAGTLDLKLTGGTQVVDSVTATWGDAVNPVAPGYTSSGTVTIKNAGTLDAQHVELQFTEVVVNNPNAAAIATDTGVADIADMSTVMEVTALSYGTYTLADAKAAFDAIGGNNDGTLQLNELIEKIISSTTVPAKNNGASQAFSMTVSIPTSVGNGIQGDQVTLTVTFGLFMDVSQNLVSL